MRGKQGTVASFDTTTHEGTAYLDTGRLLSFGAQAFARSRLRMLRLGQRVNLDLDSDGTVLAVRIPTMPKSDTNDAEV